MVNSYPIRVSDSIDDIRQCMIRTPVRSKGLPLDEAATNATTTSRTGRRWVGSKQLQRFVQNCIQFINHVLKNIWAAHWVSGPRSAQ